MRKPYFPCLCVLVSLAVVGWTWAFPALGQTVTESFDTSGSFTAYGSAGANVTSVWSPTGGKSGGGGVSVTRTTGTGTFNGWMPVPCDLTGKTTLKTSVLIHTGAWTGDTSVRYGLANNGGSAPAGSSAFLSTGSSYTGISALLEYSTSSSGRFRLQLYNKAGTGSASSLGTRAEMTNLNSGANAGTRAQWLRLNITLVPHPTAANTYNAVATLEKLGASGADAASTIMDTGVTAVANEAVFGATAAYPAYNLSIAASVATYFDDHSVALTALAPEAPVALEPTVQSTTRLTANWAAPASGEVVTGYVLELVKAGDPFTAGNFISADGLGGQPEGIMLPSGTLAQPFHSLVRTQGYKYRVRAKNMAGQSANSAEIAAATANVNTLPTLDAIAVQPSLYPGEIVTRQVGLSGITTGGDQDQTLEVTVTSSNHAVVPQPSVAYTSPSATGSVSYQTTGVAGTATITVRVEDLTGEVVEGFVEKSFTVRVQQLPTEADFDTESGLEEYGHALSSANTTFGWTSSAGQGNPPTGGLSISKTGSSAGYFNGWRTQPLDLVEKDIIRTSILVNFNLMGQSSNTSGLYLGFAHNSTEGADGEPEASGANRFLIDSNPIYRGISVFLGMNSGSSGTMTLQLQNKNVDAAATATPAVTKAAIGTTHKANWLRLNLSLSPSGVPNTYTAVATVEDLGADGTGEPTEVLTTTGELVNSAIYTCDKAYASYNLFFYNSSSAVGTVRLDNHRASAAFSEPNTPVTLPPTGITTTDLTSHWTLPGGPAITKGVTLEMVKAEDDFEPGSYIGANGEENRAAPLLLANNATSQVFINLVRGQAYKYRVKSENATGYSAYSAAMPASTSSANTPPTLDALASLSAIYPTDTVQRIIPLTGISTGGDRDQTPTIVVSSDNPAIFSELNVSSINVAAGTASLTFTPSGVTGAALVTVKAQDKTGEILELPILERMLSVRVMSPPLYFGFETAGELEEYGHEGSTNATQAWKADVGVSATEGGAASGGLEIEKIGTSATGYYNGWRTQPFDFRGASEIRTSVLVNLKDLAATTSYSNVYVGFVNNSTAGANGAPSGGTSTFLTAANNSYRALSVRFGYSTTSSGRFELQLQNKNGTAAATAVTSPAMAFVTGTALTQKTRWARVTLTMTPNGTAGSYLVTATAEDAGTDGTATGLPPFLTHSATLSSADLYVCPNAYAAYNVNIASNVAGKVYLDDHGAQVTKSVPAAPTSLTATGLTRSDIVANWSTAASGPAASGGFIVELVADGDAFEAGNFIAANGDLAQGTGVVVSAAAARSLRFTWLERNTAYRYRVRSLNTEGASEPSNEMPASTLDENTPPTLDNIPAQTVLHTGDLMIRRIDLTGISHGGDAGELITVTAEVLPGGSGVIGLVGNVGYSSPASTATLDYESAGTPGTDTIRVTVSDGDDSVSKDVVVTVRDVPSALNFNVAADFTGEYGTATSNGSIAYGAYGQGETATGGLRIDVATDDPAHVSGWRNQPYNLSDKSLIETSIMVRPTGWLEKEEKEQFYLGFAHNAPGVTNQNSLLRTGTAVGLGAYLAYDKDTSALLFGIANKAAGSTASITASQSLSSGPSLKNNWLKITVRLKPLGAGQFLVTATLDNYGTDGTLYASTLSTRTATITSATLAASTRAFAGFTSYSDEKDTQYVYVDDHEVVLQKERPLAPVAQSATGITTTNLVANWAAESTGPAPVLGSVVEMVPDGGDIESGPYVQLDGSLVSGAEPGLPVRVSDPMARSLGFTGLTQGGLYHYRVRSRNAAGQSLPSETITVQVSADNIFPTLNVIAAQAPLYPGDVAPRTVALSGITNGGDAGQVVTVQGTALTPGVISSVTVSPISPTGTATLTYVPTGSIGSTLVEVTVSDGIDTFSRSFQVRVQNPPDLLTLDAEGDVDEFDFASSNGQIVWGDGLGSGTPASGGLEVSKPASGSAASINGWRSQYFDLRGKDYIGTSILINTREWDNTGDLYLGFAEDTGNSLGTPSGTTAFLNTGTNYRGVAAYLSYASSTGTYSLSLRNKNGTGTSSAVGSTSTNSNQSAFKTHWLRLSLELVRTDNPGQYLTSARLEDLGEQGVLETPVLLCSVLNQLLTNAPLEASAHSFASYNLILNAANTGKTWLDDHQATAASGVPHAPIALDPLNVTMTNLTARWAKAAAGAGPTKGFIVEMIGPGGNFNAPSPSFIQANGSLGPQGVAVANPAAVSRLFTGLERGTAYSYRVRARNFAGESPNSDVVMTGTAAVNTPPTLDPLVPSPSLYPGDTTPRVLNLTGISNGGDLGQGLVVTLDSSDPSVATVSGLSYASPASTGSFTFTPTGAAGSTLITVTVDDGEGTVQRSFTLHVRPPPTEFGFEDAQEANGEYSYATSNAGYSAVWNGSAGAGVPPGGGVVVSKIGAGTWTLAGWRKQTFDLTNKTYVGGSLLVNPREWTGNSTTNGTVRLGFVSGAAPAGTAFLSSGDSYRSFYGQLVHNAGNNTFTVQLFNKTGTGSSVGVGSATTIANANNVKLNWLRLSAGIIPDSIGSPNYIATLRLESLGPDGTAPAEVLAEYDVPLTNEALAGATTAYAAYDVAQNSTNPGRTFLDNHEAVALATVPNAPVALEPDLVVNHAFTAKWVRPANSAVGGYLLQISTAADDFAANALIDENGVGSQASGIELAPSVTSLRITGLDPSTEYVYRVIAFNELGDGPESNVIPVATPAASFNRPPTLNPIANYPVPVAPNSGTYTVNLTGITTGGEHDQTVVLTAESGNPSAVINPPQIINYNPVAGTAQVVFEPDSVQDSGVLITVTADDGAASDNTASRSFTVIVREPPVLLGFDSGAGDLAEFGVASSTNAAVVHAPTGGVGGQGGVQITKTSSSSSTAAGWRKQPYSIPGKSMIQTSVMVKPSAWSDMSDGQFYLGFASNGGNEPSGSSHFMNTGTNYRGVSVLLNFYAGFKSDKIKYRQTLSVSLRNKDATGTSSQIGTGATINATTTGQPHQLLGKWLKVTLTLIPSGGVDTFLGEVLVEDMGANGISTPVTVSHQTGLTITNPDFANSSAAYASFTSSTSRGTGSMFLDRHEVIVNSSPPNAPVALPATIVTGGAFTTNWLQPEASSFDGYLLEVSTAPDFAPDTFVSAAGDHGQSGGITLPRTTRTLRLTGLTPGTEYWYRVFAFNEHGNGASSNVEAVETLGDGVNAPPTLNPIAFSYPGVSPESGPYTVNFSGVTDGGEGNQTLVVTAESSDPAIVPHPVVSYTSANPSGSVSFSAGSVEGTATITVTVDDGADNNNTRVRTFDVVVRQPPVLLGFDSEVNEVEEYDVAAGGQSSAASFVQTSTSGVGGGGGMEIRKNASGSNTAAGWRKQPYSIPDKSALTTSIMIKPSSWNNKGSGAFYLGFASNGGSAPSGSSHFMHTGTGYRGVGLYMNYYVGDIKTNYIKYTQTLSFSLRNKSSNDNSVQAGALRTFSNPLNKPSLTDTSFLVNKWLKLTVTLVPTDTVGGFSASWVVENLGTDGTSTPVEIFRESGITFTNADFAASQSAYAAFTMNSGSGSGPFYLDNHEVLTTSEPPPAPLVVEPTFVTAGSFIANWQRASGVYALSGYHLEVSDSPDFTTLIDELGEPTGGPIVLPATQSSLRFSGLEPDTAYHYRLRGFFSDKVGNLSAAMPASTLPEWDNARPTLGGITFPYTRISPGFGPVTVNLSGITDGGEGNQTLTVSVESDHPEIATATVHAYSSPNATGQLHVTAGQAVGTATFTVTVSDGHAVNPTTTQQFTVNVQPMPETVGFDASGDWTGEFASMANRLAIQWGASMGSGSPSGGGLYISNTSTSDGRYASAWRPQPYFLAGANAIRTSILIKPSGWVEKDDREQFFLGFTHPAAGGLPAATDVLQSNSAYRAMGARLTSRVESGEGESFRFALFNKDGTGTGSVLGNTNVPNAPTLKNNWLRIWVEFIPNGVNQYAATATLESLGANGLSAPQTLATVTSNIVNASLFGSTNAYAAFTSYIGESSNGQVYLDDHHAYVDNGPPVAPVAVSPTFVTAEGFSANWTFPSNAYATGFVLEVSEDGSFSTLLTEEGVPGASGYEGIQISSGAVRRSRVAGLEPDKTYYYRVRSVNPLFTSEPSNVAEAVLLVAGKNAAPTLDNITTAPSLVLNGSTGNLVQVTGVSAGGEDEPVTVTVLSSNAALIPVPAWTASNPAPTSGLGSSSLVMQPLPGESGSATFSFTPTPGMTGTVQITVRVSDGYSQVEKTFMVRVAREEAWVYPGNATTGANATGSQWKYSDTGVNLGTSWKDPGFNDSAWLSGPSTLGYRSGNTGIATVISYGPSSSNKYVTSYFRHVLNVANSAEVQSLVMRLRCDDGAVIYLNGIEVARTSNMPAGTITYTTRPTSLGDDGQAWVNFTIDPARLVTGNNVIAAEVHQYNSDSSDVIFDLDLKASVLPSGQGEDANPVTALPATHVAYNGFTAHWGDPPYPASGFILEVSQTSDFAVFETVVVPGAGSRDYPYHLLMGHSVNPASTYYYRVRAANDVSEIPPPNYETVTTLAAGQYTRPTLDPISNVVVPVGSGAAEILLTGISDGGEYEQFVDSVTVSTTNPGLFASIGISPAWDPYAFVDTATLVFTPAEGPGGEANVTVRVTDTGGVPNTFEQTFRITVGDPPVGPQLEVLLLPDLTVLDTPASLEFPSTVLGQSSSQTLRLRNSGDEPVTGLSLSLTGGGFSHGSLASTTLAPGATQDVAVTFSPLSVAAFSGTLQVGRIGSTPFVVNLSGEGRPIGPRLEVRLLPGETVLTSPADLVFPTTTTGQSSSQAVRLSNTGDEPVTALALALAGADAALFAHEDLAVTTLAPGASTEITVTFSPETEAAFAATLEIQTAATAGNPFVLLLAGEGELPPPLGPVLSVALLPGETLLETPASLAFPVTAPGASSTRTLRLSSVGSDPVVGLALALGGAQPADFAAGTLTQSTLAPGESTEVVVGFNPSAEGDSGAVLEITSQSGAVTHLVLDLSGRSLDDLRLFYPVEVPSASPPSYTGVEEDRSDSVLGLFEGLLRSQADHDEILGMISAVKISKAKNATAGAPLTASLYLNGRSAALKGALAPDGTVVISATQKDRSVVNVNLHLVRTPSDGFALRGTVEWNGVTVDADLNRAYYDGKLLKAPQAGAYTMMVPSQAGWGVDEPGGDGWANVSISAAGVVTVKGALGDGVAFSKAVRISAEGDFDFYLPLYRSTPIRGHIAGRLHLRDEPDVSDFDGSLEWRKFADAREALYKSGFHLNVQALGSRYVAPAKNVRMLPQLGSEVRNAEAAFVSPVQSWEHVVSWQASNAVLHYGPLTLKATGVPANGALSKGSYINGAVKFAFGGVAFQKQGIAVGTYVHGGTANAVRILPGAALVYPGSEDPGALTRIENPGMSADAPDLDTSGNWDVLAAGTYLGVVTESGGIVGGIESIVVDKKAGVSGAIRIENVRYAFRGTLDASGTVTINVPRAGADPLVLTLELAIADAVADGYQITGTAVLDGVTHVIDAQRRPPFTKLATAPQAGVYTVAMAEPSGVDPALQPAGDGYGSLSISVLGVGTGTLVLPDSTKVAFAGHVTRSGEWSLYRALYKGKGWLSGKMTFRDVAGVSDLDGAWRWNRGANVSKTVYPLGFDTTRDVVGSKYTRPLANVRAFPGVADDYHNVWLRLSGTDLSSQPALVLTEVDKPVTWTTANKVAFYGPEQVKVSFNVANGLVSGSYVDKANGVTVTFGGAMLQKQGVIAGFHLTAGQANAFVMEPR